MTSPTNPKPLKKEPAEIKDSSEIKEQKQKKNFLTSTYDELKLVV